MTTSPPISAVYAHVPFCHTICGYCDFYSVVLDKRAAAPLVDALLAELDGVRSRRPVRPRTIFVGGGTPTTLPPADLRRLLAALRADAEPDLEFTVEANPATVSDETAATLADAGVTRVSIGAQSFDPGELRVLERIHQPAQVAATVETARRCGIPQVSLDLIFAVPGQSLESWQRNLRTAIDLGPDHLSCYGLTYEKGTPLFDQLQAGAVRRLDADLEAEMYEWTIDALEHAGYRQYEVSNFARPGRECRHNLVYWRNEPYLGIGPSAAGFLDAIRYRNVPDAAAYVRAIRGGASPRCESERRALPDQARETMMLSLRLRAGVDRRAFAERFGRDPAEMFAEPVRKHEELGLLEADDEALRLTRSGLLVADSVIADFL